MITAGSKVPPSDPSVPSEESDGIPAVRPIVRTVWQVQFHASAGSDGLRTRLSDRAATVAPLASASSLIHSSQWRKLHGSL